MFLNNEVQLILGLKSDIISEKLLKQQNEQHGPAAGHPGVADGGFSQQPCQVLIADNIIVEKLLFLLRKLEEAIRESGNPTQKPAPDMERQVL